MTIWRRKTGSSERGFPGRLRLTDPQRVTLAEIGKRVGRKALLEIAFVAKPDTILIWYRKLVAQKFDGSKYRQHPGRPRLDEKRVSVELERKFTLSRKCLRL